LRLQRQHLGIEAVLREASRNQGQPAHAGGVLYRETKRNTRAGCARGKGFAERQTAGRVW
jgi:hypothetical protein